VKQTIQVVPPSDLMKYKYQQLHWFGPIGHMVFVESLYNY